MKLPVQVRYTGHGWETTAIDFADYERMGTSQHYTPRPVSEIPDFALDNKKLRMVIVERTRAHGGVRCGGPNARAHRKNVRRAGSYAAMLAGIAYRAWRLGWDSPTIANEMNMTAVCVRQQIFKMTEVAHKLAARNWIPEVPEYVEGEICWTCRKRPVDKTRNKWRCTECLDSYNARERIRLSRKRRGVVVNHSGYGGRLGTHLRWHVKRGFFSESCLLCTASRIFR